MPWQHIGYTCWVDVALPILKDRQAPLFVHEALLTGHALATFAFNLAQGAGCAGAAQKAKEPAKVETKTVELAGTAYPTKEPGLAELDTDPEVKELFDDILRRIEAGQDDDPLVKLVKDLKKRKDTRYMIDPLDMIRPIGAFQHPPLKKKEDK